MALKTLEHCLINFFFFLVLISYGCLQFYHFLSPIPSQLKFLMPNVKIVISVQLTYNNHPIWKSQFLKLFCGNCDRYLDGSTPKPSKQLVSVDGNITINHTFILDCLLIKIWLLLLIPRLLIFFSMFSCRDIWLTIECHLQSMNYFRILQLKNELYQLQMNDKSMVQYLLEIKQKVDVIVVAGYHHAYSKWVTGLSSSYQAFKIVIQTKLTPISLDYLCLAL